ncbi:MAG: DUF1566 domain-containing protein [Arenicellales bacterium]
MSYLSISTKGFIQWLALALFCSVMVFTGSSYAHNKVVVIPLFDAGNPALLYEVGDTGPAGGIVFHVTEGGLHGLEAAPVDQIDQSIGGALDWCDFDSISDISNIANLTTASDADPSKGAGNTAAIISLCVAPTAASVASSYEGPTGLTTGWHLPNKEELNLMHGKQGLIGGFTADASNYYWSSSETASSEYAWSQFFGNGNRFEDFKGNNRKVRAIRDF